MRLTLSLCRPFVDVVSSGKVSLPWLSTLVMEGCMDLPSSEDLQTVLEKLPHLEVWDVGSRCVMLNPQKWCGLIASVRVPQHLGILNCTCISQLTLVEPEDRDSLTILDISGCIELTSVQVLSFHRHIFGCIGPYFCPGSSCFHRTVQCSCFPLQN